MKVNKVLTLDWVFCLVPNKSHCKGRCDFILPLEPLLKAWCLSQFPAFPGKGVNCHRFIPAPINTSRRTATTVLASISRARNAALCLLSRVKAAEWLCRACLPSVRTDHGHKARRSQGAHFAALGPCLSTTSHIRALGFQLAGMCQNVLELLP